MVSTVLDLVSAPGVLYAAVLILLTVDAFVPVVPAQALMIGGGILSASGHAQLLLLVLSGAVGVVAGDLLAFAVGRRLARRGERRPRRALPRRAEQLTTRLHDAMQRHIFLAVLFCRFVPAGRMVTALYAGRNGVSTRRFAAYDVVAAMLWATYGALLGHFGGEAMADSSWLPLLLVAVAALVFVAGAPLLGLAGRLNKRRSAPVAPAPALLPAPVVAEVPAQIVRAAADLPAPVSPAPVSPARVSAAVGLVGRLRRRDPEAASARRSRICRRRSAVETLAAVEPLAAIEVMAAAEAVAAAESVVIQVTGLESTAQ